MALHQVEPIHRLRKLIVVVAFIEKFAKSGRRNKKGAGPAASPCVNP
jgi:hypothetical protein